MVEGESPKSFEPDKASHETRNQLRELIFQIPVTAGERQWLSYFVSQDDNLHRQLEMVQIGEMSPENFAAQLRQDIDRQLLAFLQAPPVGGQAGFLFGVVERSILMQNFDTYREDCIEMLLAQRKHKNLREDAAYKSFQRKLTHAFHAQKKNKKYLSSRSVAREELKVSRVANMAELRKAFFIRRVDLDRFETGMAKSKWVRRQAERILAQDNASIQDSLIETFAREFPQQLF